ncbi:MAG TPA: ABC transporter permease [Anaerolineae bacterium]|nr:ABC transporter permease [Anaerolineae bacterium]
MKAVREKKELQVLALIFPSAFWLIVFFLVPLLIVFVMSFARRGTYGGVKWELSIQNYIRFFDPLYLRIFGRSIYIALATTVLCLLAGYPLAYYIARRPESQRNTMLLLLMVPFWTNFLVRTYAWILLLRNEGLINQFLQGLGITHASLPLLYNDGAIIVGLVYGWLPDMVLPCYAAIERLDFSLVEAAQDLYANRVQAFLRVVLPLTAPGIIAGSILVFIPSLGAYVTPDLLGGAKSVMIGNLIQQQFLSVRDWPFGAAISFVLMAVMLGGTLLYFRVGGRTL